MNWDEYKSEFQPDGRLMDICVVGADLNDWQSFVDFLRKTEAGLDYFVDEAPAELPASIDEVVVDQDHAHLLVIVLDGVTVNCHFLVLEEIELDFDPREIDCEAKAKVVFRLMSTVGRVLNKQVILMPETADGKPTFKYEPGVGIRHLPLEK
jgi:hypothetical protein